MVSHGHLHRTSDHASATAASQLPIRHHAVGTRKPMDLRREVKTLEHELHQITLWSALSRVCIYLRWSTLKNWPVMLCGSDCVCWAGHVMLWQQAWEMHVDKPKMRCTSVHRANNLATTTFFSLVHLWCPWHLKITTLRLLLNKLPFTLK